MFQMDKMGTVFDGKHCIKKWYQTGKKLLLLFFSGIQLNTKAKDNAIYCSMNRAIKKRSDLFKEQ